MHVGQVIGPFTITKELGSGAMGSVYLADMEQDGQIKSVALKVIAFGLSSNDQALARFEREFKILKQMKHPNIVKLIATGKYKKTPFFAMEYVEGRSLDKIIQERTSGALGRPPFTWEEVVDYGRQLCSALEHAHEKGIIHRDLKPSNLMVTHEGILKLTDFGIAKDVDVTALTAANNTIGTAAYMSPEQCKGEKNLSGKSDLYSLGVVFYELLTGKKPFEAESSVDMFLMHVNGTFVRPARLNPEIPIPLDNLICQMMEKVPDHRPRDAAMVGQVLQEIYEKMTTLRSLAEDASKARAIDRVYMSNIPNKEDRAAAKAVKAGAKKKKLRKKKRPIYTRGWFVAIVSLAFLSGFASLMVFVVFAPPSKETLSKRIESESDLYKRESLIEDYLKHYGEKKDELTEKIRAMERETKVAIFSNVILNRHHSSRLREIPREEDDPTVYASAMIALDDEDKGNAAESLKRWREIEKKMESETDPNKAVWGWMAHKKLEDNAKTIQRFIAIIKSMNDDFRLENKDIKFEDSTHSQIANAHRFEELEDWSRSYAAWELLAKSFEKSAENRNWYTFARFKMREIDNKKDKPKDDAERIQLLTKHIAAAKASLSNEIPANRRNARNRLRDIRDLYDTEGGEVSKLAAEARKLIEQFPN